MNRQDCYTLLRGDSPLLKVDAGRGPCPFPTTRVVVIWTHAGGAIELWFFDAQGQAVSFESQPSVQAAREHTHRCFEWETLEWKRIPKAAPDPFAHAMAALRGGTARKGPSVVWAWLRGWVGRAG